MALGRTVNVIVPIHLLFFLLPTNVSGQTLDNRTAIYILSGIAGLYTLISCFCFIIIVCVCCKGRRKSRQKAKKYLKGKELEGLVPDCRLLPIDEAPELELSTKVDEDESTFFENKYAEDFQERDGEIKIVETGSDDKEATIFMNKSAHDRDVELLKKEHNLKFQNSPLGRHTPKILPHQIKVPYSEDASSTDGSEPETISSTRLSALSWREPSKPWPQNQSNKHDSPSISVSKEDRSGQLRMRKFDSSSYAAERRKDIAPSTKSSTNNNDSEKGRPKVDKASLGVVTSHADLPKTSPLPRSDNTKEKANDKTITLVKLHAELSPVVKKWYNVGIQLKVPNKTLNAIKVINRNNTDVCMLRVCEEWFTQQKKCNKVPEWSTVVDVLRSQMILESELADSLYDKYCSDNLAESDEEEEIKSKSYTWIN